MKTILAHSSNFTRGRTKDIGYIVLHYTAGNGDTAENNGKFFASADKKASAHYFVDENTIVQSVPDTDTAWHAGNWDMNCRSIGVEMCSKKDANGIYYIPAATVENAQQLVRQLMQKYGVDIESVLRHYDVTGKKCPAPMVDETKWQTFKTGLLEQRTAAWAEDAWQKAKTKGILDGTRPQDPVSRQELAVVLQRLKMI